MLVPIIFPPHIVTVIIRLSLSKFLLTDTGTAPGVAHLYLCTLFTLRTTKCNSEEFKVVESKFSSSSSYFYFRKDGFATCFDLNSIFSKSDPSVSSGRARFRSRAAPRQPYFLTSLRNIFLFLPITLYTNYTSQAHAHSHTHNVCVFKHLIQYF